MSTIFNLKDLKKFINSPSNSYFNGNTEYEEIPQRPGFFEITAEEGPWKYRDSYTGHTRSRGNEIVSYEGKPVWCSLYGGGMVKGREALANETFDFLKKAFRSKNSESGSFRGPTMYKEGDWIYSYRQEGDVEEFSGYEEIQYKGEVVFFHRVIGGLVISN